MLRFARGNLEAALQRQGDFLKRTAHPGPDSTPGIAVTIDPAARAAIGPDGFRRVRSNQALKITASDERGAMYGVLDVAEQIRTGTTLDRIPERTARAELEFRAIKFNLPWSAYRTSPALEQHQETCKDPY